MASASAAQKILGRLGAFGLALAGVGGVSQMALYNGKLQPMVFESMGSKFKYQ
jgi:hypothetical protein